MLPQVGLLAVVILFIETAFGFMGILYFTLTLILFCSQPVFLPVDTSVLYMSRFGERVACFRYASIDVNSVYLPPHKLDFSCENQEWIQKEANEVC